MSKVRVTLTLDEDVLDVYRIIAKATNTKLSPCINDWLGSTSVAFELMTNEIELIKQRPKEALNSLILFQEKMDENIESMGLALDRILSDDKKLTEASRPVTPHSNTGVNPPISPISGAK